LLLDTVVDIIGEQPAVWAILQADGFARAQIVIQQAIQIFNDHFSPPGHGNATAANPAKSNLAYIPVVSIDL